MPTEIIVDQQMFPVGSSAVEDLVTCPTRVGRGVVGVQVRLQIWTSLKSTNIKNRFYITNYKFIWYNQTHNELWKLMLFNRIKDYTKIVMTFQLVYTTIRDRNPAQFSILRDWIFNTQFSIYIFAN